MTEPRDRALDPVARHLEAAPSHPARAESRARHLRTAVTDETRQVPVTCHGFRRSRKTEGFFFFPLTYKVTKKHKDTGKIEDPAGFL